VAISIPVAFRRIDKDLSTEYIRFEKNLRVMYRTINVRLCGKMDDSVYLVILENPFHRFGITYVSFYE
jgi:hypothetical protein